MRSTQHNNASPGISPGRVQKVIKGHTVTVIRGPVPTGAGRIASLSSADRITYFLTAAREAGAKPWFNRPARCWYVGINPLTRWASINGLK
ncbi:hypothetical protein LMG28138_03905 [Pararobbsia alpina]|uniref:Uncharacterized protein n=1 Tax=Pararobbsia alpina TaxID=621374 RepID=A0A6S7BDA5_9BURK|nr:hypothetical protein LMG28138_03905 [Pararobbsia alpina]